MNPSNLSRIVRMSYSLIRTSDRLYMVCGSAHIGSLLYYVPLEYRTYIDYVGGRGTFRRNEIHREWAQRAGFKVIPRQFKVREVVPRNEPAQFVAKRLSKKRILNNAKRRRRPRRR